MKLSEVVKKYEGEDLDIQGFDVNNDYCGDGKVPHWTLSCQEMLTLDIVRIVKKFGLEDREVEGIYIDTTGTLVVKLA